MPVNNQKEEFYWWFLQAKECLLLTRNPGIKAVRYVTVCCLQQSAEYAFKAVIASLSNREVKTHNPYALIRIALNHITEISTVFPRNTDHEMKLFHYLKPGFVMSRGQVELLPYESEIEELIKRIGQLHTIVEVCFLKIIANEKA